MEPQTTQPRISVCMAAYNGARHIQEQIESILPEIGAHDEVIVVNDCSTDETAAIVTAIPDSRIRLINAEQNRGYVATFERALGEARGSSFSFRTRTMCGCRAGWNA
ncbi:glycosyltransferase [Pseudarthrobacter sp. Fe7]|nr:glycosyltransferase [Pseudarthrobacter sp. Fe7]